MFPGALLTAFDRPYGEVDLLVGSNFLALHPKAQVNLGLSDKGANKYVNGSLEVIENPFSWMVRGAHPRFQAERARVVVPMIGSELGFVILPNSCGLLSEMQSSCSPRTGPNLNNLLEMLNTVVSQQKFTLNKELLEKIATVLPLLFFDKGTKKGPGHQVNEYGKLANWANYRCLRIC